MIVDDRLDTVLRTYAAGGAGLRTQFRQLCDILGRTPPDRWTETHSIALNRIDELHDELGDLAGAVLIGTCALRSPLLVDHFARRGPRSALAAIAQARLSEADWLGMIPTLPVQARGFLRHRRDLGPRVEQLLEQLGITDFVLPEPGSQNDDRESADDASGVLVNLPIEANRRSDSRAPGKSDENPDQDATGAGIGAIVRRIEAFRRDRGERAARPAGPVRTGPPGQVPLPFGDEPAQSERALAQIDISIDAGGTIIAADEIAAPMIVGHRPFVGDIDSPARTDEPTRAAFAAALPLVAGVVTIEGAAAIAGTWRIDGVPVFARAGGQFSGYRAWLRRPPQLSPAAIAARRGEQSPNGMARESGTDRLHQLLHELRTPINAIQGFAELIQQQLFGPTPHQYRGLAASIAADAARMLADFEDVERLIGLETGRLLSAPGESDLNAILSILVGQLEPVIAPREIRLRCQTPDEPLIVGLSHIELERILWRLLSVVIGAAAPGERLAISLDGGQTRAWLALPLPVALAMRDDDALFAPDVARGAAIPGAGLLGSGFSLRLASAEIRAAGGNLERRGATLTIALPRPPAARIGAEEDEMIDPRRFARERACGG